MERNTLAPWLPSTSVAHLHPTLLLYSCCNKHLTLFLTCHEIWLCTLDLSGDHYGNAMSDSESQVQARTNGSRSFVSLSACSRNTGMLPPNTLYHNKRAKLSQCCMTSCLTVHMLRPHGSRLAASIIGAGELGPLCHSVSSFMARQYQVT